MYSDMNRKWIIAIVAFAFGATGLYNAGLLASAFARNPFPHSAESVLRGKGLFERYCVACHGATGRGDGPAAASLPAHMDDLSGLAPPPIFPDGVVAYRIAHGKDLMPAWQSVLSEDEIWDLINFVRSLRPPDKG